MHRARLVPQVAEQLVQLWLRLDPTPCEHAHQRVHGDLLAHDSQSVQRGRLAPTQVVQRDQQRRAGQPFLQQSAQIADPPLLRRLWAGQQRGQRVRLERLVQSDVRDLETSCRRGVLRPP